MVSGRQTDAQRSVILISPKGTEPPEGVFSTCCVSSSHLGFGRDVRMLVRMTGFVRLVLSLV
jgi:hypothetical protein